MPEDFDNYDGWLAARLKRVRARAEMMAPPPVPRSRGRARSLTVVAAGSSLLALAAGGVIAVNLTAKHVAPSPRPSRTPVTVPVSPSVGPRATPTPTAAPSPTLEAVSPAGAVISDWIGSSTYIVRLVNDGGTTVASTRARSWSGYPHLRGSSAFASTIPTSELDTRLYYLDGDTTIRYLKADGSSGVAAEVPGTSTTRPAFSVSPDDTRIAVSLMTWTNQHFHEQAYVEDLGTGAHHVALFNVDGNLGTDSSTATTWLEMPLGWHDGDIVYGQTSPWNQYIIRPDLPVYNGYSLVDPTSGAQVLSLCQYDGQVLALFGIFTTPPTAGGVLCQTGPFAATQVQLRSWSGAIIEKLGDGACAEPAAVAPDGTVALWDGGNFSGVCPPNPQGKTRIVRGRATTEVSAIGSPVGWIDDGHLVVINQKGGYIDNGDLTNPMQVLTVSSGRLTTASFEGLFVGAVPGGL